MSIRCSCKIADAERYQSPNLVHYSTYAEAELLECAQIMLDYVLDPDLNTSSSFFKKVSSGDLRCSSSRRYTTPEITSCSRTYPLHCMPRAARIALFFTIRLSL